MSSLITYLFLAKRIREDIQREYRELSKEAENEVRKGSGSFSMNDDDDLWDIPKDYRYEDDPDYIPLKEKSRE